MKNNKYLKELGLTWRDLPGNFDKRLTNCPAGDIRNKEDNEGFCSYEFFSLDYSLALYIYPRLCYFKDHYATIATPGCFCYERDGITERKNGNQEWIKTIEKMILAFKLIIKKPDNWIENSKEISDNIEEGLKLFAEYYSCLWY